MAVKVPHLHIGQHYFLEIGQFIALKVTNIWFAGQAYYIDSVLFNVQFVQLPWVII